MMAFVVRNIRVQVPYIQLVLRAWMPGFLVKILTQDLFRAEELAAIFREDFCGDGRLPFNEFVEVDAMRPIEWPGSETSETSI